MAHVSLRKKVDAPAAQVWERVRDLPGYADWLVIHRKWTSELPAELRTGSTFSSVVSVKGLANPIDWTVDDYKEPRLLAMSGTGPMNLKVALSIEVIDPGGHAEVEAEVEVDTTMSGGPLVGPMGKLVERAAKGDIKKSLDNLAGLVAGL